MSERGRAQIRALARHLAVRREPVTAIYTSPLARAVVTARAIAEVAEVAPVPRDGLIEWNFGAMTGLTPDEVRRLHPDVYEAWCLPRNMEFTWPGGDSRRSAVDRIVSTMATIVDENPSGTVVAVGHGGTLSMYLAHTFEGELIHRRRYSLENCSVTRVRWHDGQPELIEINYQGHLDACCADAEGLEHGTPK